MVVFYILARIISIIKYNITRDGSSNRKQTLPILVTAMVVFYILAWIIYILKYDFTRDGSSNRKQTLPTLITAKVLRFALKTAKLTLHKIAKSLNGHKTST